MRAPASSLRSLVQLRAGVVAAPGQPARRPGCPASRSGIGSSRWASILTYLVPLLFAAALAACDGAGPTAPDSSESALPGRAERTGRPDRPSHVVTIHR